MGALSYVRSYFGGAAKTTLNVAIYAATLGKFVLLNQTMHAEYREELG